MNPKSRNAKKDGDKLEKLFKKHRFTDFKWIDPEKIVVSQWVRMKCTFGCGNFGRNACCPPNVLRFIAGVGGYMYAQRAGDLYVNLFASGRSVIPRPGGDLTLRQETGYPWDGEVSVTLEPAQPEEFTVHVRVPGWAVNLPVPGTLYSVLEPPKPWPLRWECPWCGKPNPFGRPR